MKKYTSVLYVYLSTELKHNVDVPVLYLSISILSYIWLLLHYISQGNIAFLHHYIYLTALDTSYFAD